MIPKSLPVSDNRFIHLVYSLSHCVSYKNSKLKAPPLLKAPDKEIEASETWHIDPRHSKVMKLHWKKLGPSGYQKGNHIWCSVMPRVYTYPRPGSILAERILKLFGLSSIICLVAVRGTSNLRQSTKGGLPYPEGYYPHYVTSRGG